MWVIVGLGNPGADYAHTRHNAGFMVVETVARRWRIALCDDGPALRLGSGRVAGQSVLLAEPQMFMNRSGEALAHCRRQR
jgi:PTH1 family peptidyl-tRNA hydrolase